MSVFKGQFPRIYLHIFVTRSDNLVSYWPKSRQLPVVCIGNNGFLCCLPQSSQNSYFIYSLPIVPSKLST